MYASYNISLTKDYERLTAEQKAATVFENLVDVDGLKKITGTSGAAEFEFTDGDGWLGMYFANFPKEDMTILMGTQKKDAGTFPLTRKLRNVVISEYLG